MDYSRDFRTVFHARLSYCQGLAAHLAQCPGLGYGWLSVTWARLAPLFAQGNATVSWSIQMARRYVLDRLWWTRASLEAARAKDPKFTEYDQIGWIARVLVSGFSHPAVPRVEQHLMLLVLAVLLPSICVTCQLGEQHLITFQCYTSKVWHQP